MKAIVCERPGQLTLAERPEPVPGPGEVLVRIRRAGVCGTDLHIFQGKHPYLDYPRVIGHELAGEVAAVGAPAAEADSGFAVGQRVCIIPYLACGRCRACTRGKPNCCRDLRVLGVHCDGGFAEYVAVPAGNLIATDDLDLDQAAMVEFLAVGAHGVGRASPKADDRVLVVGAGPIGAAAMLFAKLRGAEVTALDMRADRLALCRDALGVDHVVTVGEGIEPALAARTDQAFYDVVIDATGNLASMERSFGLLGHGGVYVLLGVVRDHVGFSHPEFHKREATLHASRNATREDFAAVLAAMREGRVPTAAFATHRAELADIAGLFPSWIRPEAGVLKALIEL